MHFDSIDIPERGQTSQQHVPPLALVSCEKSCRIKNCSGCDSVSLRSYPVERLIATNFLGARIRNLRKKWEER